MKKLLFIPLIFLFQNLFSQTPVPMASQSGLSYTETFADIANWSNNFTTGVGAAPFKSVSVGGGGAIIPNALKITAATATFVTTSSAGVQRGIGNIVLLSTGASDNTSSTAIDFYADYTGVNAGKLSFDWATVFNSTGTRTGSLKIYTSTDGTNFNELTTAAVTSFVNNVAGGGTISNIDLPSNFNNSSTCIIRFYYHNGVGGTNGSRPKISIDNLTITATATTGVDNTKPTVSTYFPANNAVVSNLSVVPKLTFSESIQKGVGNVTITNITDNTNQVVAISSTDFTVNNADLTFNNQTFVNGKTYAIQMADGSIKDLATNPNTFDGITNNTTWTFSFNANPVAVNDNYLAFTNENLNENLGTNDTDPNNSALTYAVLANPSSGSVVVNSNGTFTYTPPTNFTGTTSFTYTVTNANSYTATGTVNLTIANRSQVIISQIYEGTSINKWVELTNLSNSPINTTSPQLKLALYNSSGDAGNINFNNTTVPTQTVNLNFTIPARSTVYLGNGANSDEIPYITVAQSIQNADGVINFNGNDGIALLDASNNIIDAFGQGINAKDKSYVRKQSVLSGNNKFISADWIEVPLLTVQEADDVNDPNRFGIHIPGNTSPCITPTAAPTNLVFGTAANTSITASFTAAVADEYLVIRSTSSTFTGIPVDGTTYQVNDVLGNGIVVSRGGTTSFTTNNLTNGTTYYFYIYAINSITCNSGPLYYTGSNLTGNQTTTTPPPCATPTTQPSGFTITAFGYNAIQGAFTISSADEYLVVMSTTPTLSSSPTNGTTYFVNDNLGGGTVIKRGSTNTFSKTGLTASTTYYFKVFAINSSCTGGPVYQTINPLEGNQTTSVYDINALNFYYGNLHAHSASSDGNKDNRSKTVTDNFNFAKTADKMDFLGISEHNHTLAGMDISRWQPGINASRAVTDATFLGLYGMEWGTTSSGGHVIVYGIDSLINWENNQFQIYVPKGTYTGNNGLFRIINRHGLNAFAYLAHPVIDDFNNIRTTYDLMADSAIIGSAVESGPANSTTVDYTNPSNSPYGYLSYFKDMLAKGYHLAPMIDHDNHYLTFGKTARSRTAVLSPSLSENDILASIKAMRIYATQDDAAQVKFTINTQPLGSIMTDRNAPNIVVNVLASTTAVTSIKLMYGVPGSGVTATELTSSTTSPLMYTDNALADLSTGYYYADITETDGKRVITAPIWYTRDDNGVLPITLKTFTAKASGNFVALKWVTSSEVNNNFFTIERSADGKNFTKIVQVEGAGNSNKELNYLFNDDKPFKGTNYYRLRQTDFDGKFTYSMIRAATILSGEAKGFNIYPNPAINEVTLALNSEAKDLQLKVISAEGRIVLQGKGNVSQMNQLLNQTISSLNTGIYVIRLNNNTEAYATKLIKN